MTTLCRGWVSTVTVKLCGAPVDADLDAVLDSLGELAGRLGIVLNVEDLTGDDADE